ncbi:tetratricopeptide repeat protein [Schumannella luteola]|uniref:Putative thioredoxin n=1 Tax=Schumannella luteola TaxID=472059 RepID=A0A852YGT1_9MICO|nr:tetratricopeptide repeat protein [Schumannella luteola]NYG99037.1 putative thioredoxin [Schumannella luteola]TPX06393.1 tetratricopeptide repeat protein [Schumannella luteola]
MTDPRLAAGANLRGAVDLSSLVNRAADPEGAASAAAAADGSQIVFETDDTAFEQVLQLSNTVPVIIEIVASGLEPALPALVRSYGGRLALAVVDGNRSPGIAQAFQAQQVPTVGALVAGRPLGLYVGGVSDADARQVLDQVLQAATQAGVTGRLDAGAGEEGDEPAEPVEEPLPPLHQEAYDAIGEGDYARAIAAYEKAITQNPRDAQAVAGLAQVSLLDRLQGADAQQLRSAAADAPADLDAQLAVADLDVSGGHLDDAADRLLDLFLDQDQAGRDRIRARLLEYFEIAGPDDARVARVRARLTSLLY